MSFFNSLFNSFTGALAHSTKLLLFKAFMESLSKRDSTKLDLKDNTPSINKIEENNSKN